MKKTSVILGLVLLTFVLFVGACSSGTASSTAAPASTASQEGASLVQERCSACHPLTRVESQRLSAAEWGAVVDQMIARGAQLSADEKTIVVNYLAANYGK